ncbi:hypothetical protein GGX14DRAFT_554571 [Mycena pura]|uniref:F-box domain-containing protein n=1 Tax=Mycena pura TaxID=153505 RepID=A0AAD6YT28_9AGAR|nr:hypothetical protein GGX14DRAFT_554571 [Mycena pura]
MDPSVSGLQLLDLPNELILLILLADLPSDALLCLASLCRRLHYLALPLYFASYGMDDPTQSVNVVMLDNQQDPLSALQMALFISSITQLSCSLPHYESSIYPLGPHIRRLRALVTRLESVREVTITWDAPNSSCCATNEDVEELASEIGMLLNMILKRGCTSLTLRHGKFFSRAYEYSPPRDVVRPVDALRSVVRHIVPKTPSFKAPRDAWRALKALGNIVLDPETDAASVLTHLKIESSMFLFPPCLSWLLSALRSSSISSIELTGVTLPTKIWSAVLPLIASLVPTVTQLTISHLYGISGIDILEFLAKLPRLQSLTIGYTEYSRHIQSSCPDSGPVPILRELTHLHAPSTFILHFLKKKSLPNLSSLCITPRKLILGFRGMRHIGQFVSDIVCRLEKHKLSPTVCLEIHGGLDSGTEMAADLAHVLPAGVLRCLRVITRLIMYSESDVLTAPELVTIARWITRFPALVHVSLRVRGTSNDDSDAWATLDSAQSILEQNPNVQSLELNGRLFDTLRPVAREIPPHVGL